VLFHAAQLAQLSFDGNVPGVRAFHHTLGDGDVLRERFVRGVDHYGRIKTGIDAIGASGLIAVVEVHGKNRIREYIRDTGIEYVVEWPNVFEVLLGKATKQDAIKLTPVYTDQPMAVYRVEPN
jgi:hypothetical protein